MVCTRWNLAVLLLALGGCDTDPASTGAEGSTGETSGGSTADIPGTGGESTTGVGTSGSGSTGEGTSSSTGDGSSSTTDTSDCDAFEPGNPFEIAADASTTRIHPHAAGDGSGAWFSFVEPEPSGSLFDVAVLHLRCAGVVDVPRQVVSTAPGNDIDASVAVSGDRVLVVWNTDDGSGGSSNLQIHGRVLNSDGVPLEDSQFRVTTSVQGTEISENHTFALVNGTDDGFSVAGLRAHPDSPAFVAFRQPLDGDGTLLGEALGPPVEEGVSHLLAASSGSWLSYQRSNDMGDQVWLVSPEATAAAAFEGVAAQGGQVVARPDAPTMPLVAGTIGSGSALDVGVALGTAAPLLLGAAGTIEHSPTVAVSPEGALAVVFHRNLGGLNNAVVFQRLAIGGKADAQTVVTLGDELELDTQSPPYPPSLTWTDGGWLVTWSRGQSPEFSTWGQVLAPS
ncbi:MAG: hypothetical protein ACRBN8_42665 [Nannocystales bacterium]